MLYGNHIYIVGCNKMKRDAVLEAIVLTTALSVLVCGCKSQGRLQTCPTCAAALDRVPMLVGLPTKDMADKVDRGEALLAGCVGDPHNPEQAFVCLKCRKWKTQLMKHWQPLPQNFGRKVEGAMEGHPTRQ